MFEVEKKFYEEHKEEFISKYLGKKLLIVGSELIKVFDTDSEALMYANGKYESGTFMVKNVVKGEETVQRFYSRVW